MPEFKGNPRWRLWLLRIDAFVDSAAWNASQGFSRFWGSLVDHSSLIRMRGWKRALFELASEGATLGAAGSIVLLLFAIPAFKATEGDWRARGDYAVTFEDKTAR